MNLTFPAGKASHIAVIDDFLDPQFCADILLDLRKNAHLFAPGRTLGGLNPDMKLSRDLNLHEDHVGGMWDSFADYDQAIAERVGEFLTLYIQEFPSIDVNLSSFGDTGYQAQMYRKDEGYYRQHIDGCPWSGPDRVAALILYLNDVEEGGETEFPVHDLRVQPKAGRAVAFPSSWTYPHAGLVPLSNDKWILTTFIVSTNVV